MEVSGQNPVTPEFKLLADEQLNRARSGPPGTHLLPTRPAASWDGFGGLCGSLPIAKK